MNPKRPPLAALGPATTWPLASRVSSPTSFHTPAKRAFTSRCAASSDGATSAPIPTTSDKATARIRLRSTCRGHRVERHDVDPVDLVLPVQHALHLHLVSRERRALRRHAQERKGLRAERLGSG